MAVKELSKKRKAAPASDAVTKKKKVEKKATKAATQRPSKNAAKPTEDDIEARSASSEDDQNDADRTAALLKGFESSSDEDADAAPNPDELAADTGLTDAEIPTIPTTASASLSISKQTPGTTAINHDPPTILYIGHIPHGFREPQMRSYFSQFGVLTHLRLSRNRRTGAPKHYAFLEFASGIVARIVAETMDNYLLFGHILKVKVVDAEKGKELVEKGLWKGEGRRWKRIPHAGIERGLMKSAGREQWEGRVRKERRRRAGKADKLRKLGYEFDMPKLRSVRSVPRRDVAKTEVEVGEMKAVEAKETKAAEAGEKEELKKIEAAPAGETDLQGLLDAQKATEAAEAEPVLIKSKKGKRSQQVEDAEVTGQEAVGGGTKRKKQKKATVNLSKV